MACDSKEDRLRLTSSVLRMLPFPLRVPVWLIWLFRLAVAPAAAAPMVEVAVRLIVGA